MEDFIDSQGLADFVDSLGFRSLDKVYRSVKERFPNTTRADVKEYLDSLGTDRKASISQKKLIPRMGKSYSHFIGGWQMDLFIYQRKYYLLAIEMNSRYAYLSDVIKRKTTAAILPELKTFVERYKPVCISCDNEGAFTSKEAVDYLVSKDVELRVVTEQVHSALGILNRFCRTLRDMLAKTGSSPSEAVKAYNNTYHRMIGMKPSTMFHDSELEEAYISKCIFENEAKLKRLHDEIKPGMKVRYVLDTNKHEKTRYRLSPSYYLVDSIDNFKAAIVAKDGYVKSVPLYRIVKLKPSETRVPFADTMEGSSRGVIEDMVDYNPKSKTAKVRFKLPNRGYEVQSLPIRYLREQIPTRVSDLEMQYMEAHPEYELKGRYLSKR